MRIGFLKRFCEESEEFYISYEGCYGALLELPFPEIHEDFSRKGRGLV